MANVCSGSTNEECYYEAREEIIYGGDYSAVVSVSEANSKILQKVQINSAFPLHNSA